RDVRAAALVHPAHAGAQIDPELRIGLSEADRCRTRDEPDEAKRRQCCFIEPRGAIEIADGDGDVIDHVRLPLLDVRLWNNGAVMNRCSPAWSNGHASSVDCTCMRSYVLCNRSMCHESDDQRVPAIPEQCGELRRACRARQG